MFHVVVNPAGASGRTGRIWAELEPVFRESGKPYEVHFSTKRHGLGEICAELTQNADTEYTDIVVVGGDGTMNEVLNGIGDLRRVRLGYIPGGSANDFGLDIGLPKDRAQIARTILEGRVHREENVGEVLFHNVFSEFVGNERRVIERREENSGLTRRFLVSCGIGFDAAVCEQVESSRFKNVLNKLHVGKLIYIAVAIRMILRCPMQTFKITLRGRSALPGAADVPSPELVMEKKNTLFAVGMNHRYEGGGFQFCPHARPDDGSVDFCMASPASRLQFFQVFPKAYSGDHVKFDLITQDRAEEITMETELPSWVHTDGEIHFTSTKITLRTLPQKIRFLM